MAPTLRSRGKPKSEAKTPAPVKAKKRKTTVKAKKATAPKKKAQEVAKETAKTESETATDTASNEENGHAEDDEKEGSESEDTDENERNGDADDEQKVNPEDDSEAVNNTDNGKVSIVVEHSDTCHGTYKRNANRVLEALRKEFPGIDSVVNPTQPRYRSFELTLKKSDGTEILIWTGLKKGPPKKLKFPDAATIISSIKEHLS